MLTRSRQLVGWHLRTFQYVTREIGRSGLSRMGKVARWAHVLCSVTIFLFFFDTNIVGKGSLVSFFCIKLRII
jgi:hypothetical protein